jgi:hypothetical protein
LTKNQTHASRPVSSYIKEDFDAGLEHHNITLEKKHYEPLLSFLNQSPYIFQQSFAPNVVQTGVEAHGGYPPDFDKQASGCKEFLNLSDAEAKTSILLLDDDGACNPPPASSACL